MRDLLRVTIAALLSLFLSITVISCGKDHGVEPENGWNIHTIDDSVGIQWSTSIAVDSYNKVHIGYNDNINHLLKYATNKSGSWQTYALDSQGYAGAFPSIAADSEGNMHISYLDGSHLGYITNKTGIWQEDVVDTDGGSYTSLAVDLDDNIHISYENPDFMTDIEYLKYATNETGEWLVAIIDSITLSLQP